MFVTYKDVYITISMGFLKTRRDWDDIFNRINQIKLLMKYIIHRKIALHIWKRDEDIPRPKKKKKKEGIYHHYICFRKNMKTVFQILIK